MNQSAGMRYPYLTAGTPAGGSRRSKQVSMAGPVTCPGFPGYCSESYVGDTCTVVCARGRNNVPQCQVTSDTR